MVAPSETAPSLGALAARLDDVMVADQRLLRRRIDRARKLRDAGKRQAEAEEIATAVAEAEQRVERRRASLPEIHYPAELPVSQRRDELAEAIRDHQVVIVAGETGSGKTTQLPKICLEIGRGVRGTIGHTQPRRLAARTVAERIAEELRTSLGSTVGYAVRFTDRVSDQTLVKLMTDGILLAEIHRDPTLSAYDTIIIDEAHERSLNVDFLLGYLKELLPKRPDLKVIVTSATIDPERFAEHFSGAPIIEVSGRTYPVEMRYRPLDPSLGEGEAEGDREGSRAAPVRDQIQGICDAIDELRAEPPGDILVFLSGEREIRDTADAVRAMNLANTDILPLYARLPTAEQRRVFSPSNRPSGGERGGGPGRRVVLATNVAETSLTVPGIRYVIDPGTARISRYSHRLKVQRLPIEAISQASANQRAGRCGRVAAGICIRLYDEEDFVSRPAFTEPEILRTNLASVILQMTSLGLGDIAAFPFLEPPDRRAITDGVRLLQELGALEPGSKDDENRLTPIGRQLARLPVDPRFARMVIEAQNNGCLREVLVIASALSIEDPRERPTEKAGTADQMHARFADPSSDFLAYLNVWNYVRDQQRALSSNQFRKLCRAEFLNYLRIREWQDVHSQLRQVALSLGMKQASNTEAAAPDLVHRSLLAGLLSHIGYRDRDARDREFRGARNARFAVFPGSALAKKPPQWVMAAELVETSRLWARTVGRIQPEWAEQLAPHLVKRSYSEPHWSAERGSAMAYETVTLYGLPIVTRRLVPFGRIDPEYARELFIRHALVEGDWRTHHSFFRENRELLTELAELEHRFRRNDLVIDDDTVYRLYDERIGENVSSARHFDSWWKKKRRTDPDLLTFSTDLLLTEAAHDLDEADFPASWIQGGMALPLSYAYQPGVAGDGVMVHIPLAVLNQVRVDGFDWQVPGFREERVVELMRSLPKPLRRNLVPMPDNARIALQRMDAGKETLLDALARELFRIGGQPIPRDAWDLDRLPDHLSVTFRVEDEEGQPLADGKDLDELKRRLAPRLRATLAQAARGIEQSGLRAWSFGELPRRVEDTSQGRSVVAYPALVDEGETVAIRLFEHPADQDEAMWAGIRRLLRMSIPVSARNLRDRVTREAKLALATNPYASVAELVDDTIVTALDALMVEHGAPVWDATDFDTLHAKVRDELEPRALAIASVAGQILAAVGPIERRLAEPSLPALIPALDDMVSQLGSLVYSGFIGVAGADRLADVLRYLDAMGHRLDALPRSPQRDRERMQQVHRVEHAYAALIDSASPEATADPELEHIGWMIEELRVSLFAQQLRTPEPASEKRIMKAIERLRR